MSALDAMADNIRAARKAAGWKMEDLAARVGVHENTVRRLEQHSSPNARPVETVAAAALALDVEMWALFLPNGAAASKLIGLLSLLSPDDVEVLLRVAERFADAAADDDAFDLQDERRPS